MLWPFAAIFFIEEMKPNFNDPICLVGLILTLLFGFTFVRATKKEETSKVIKDSILLIICSILVATSFGAFIWFNIPAPYLGLYMIFSIGVIYLAYRVTFGKKK